MKGNEENSNPEDFRVIDRLIAAVIIVSADGKILMGRNNPKKGGVYPNVWHIPGGGVDVGETLKEAARREVLEEVGLKLSEIELTPLLPVGHGETVKVLPSGEKVWAKMTFNRFEARIDMKAADIELHANDDLMSLRWFDRDELADAEQIPGGKEFFAKVGYIDK